jgi:hypothetical protein
VWLDHLLLGRPTHSNIENNQRLDIELVILRSVADSIHGFQTMIGSLRGY